MTKTEACAALAELGRQVDARLEAMGGDQLLSRRQSIAEVWLDNELAALAVHIVEIQAQGRAAGLTQADLDDALWPPETDAVQRRP